MKKFKNITIILFFAVSFLLVLGHVLAKPVENLDELWNYNIAKQIAGGLVVYKDISLITTPLVPVISSLFLKLIADELIVFRVLNGILALAIFVMSFLILRRLTKKTSISLLCTMVIVFLYYPFITMDYNYGTLLIFLIIEYLIVRKFDEEKFKTRIGYNLLIGILLGLSILSKQTIGLIISVFTLLVPIIRLNKKEDLKVALKNILWRILGLLIPIAIFIIYLLATGSFNDFLSYCIEGVRHFNNSISYFKLFENKNVWTKALSIIMPALMLILVIINAVKILKKKKDKNLLVLTWLSIPMLFAMYPIADDAHFYVGILPLMITILYLLGSVDFKVGKVENALITSITVFAILLISFMAYKEFLNYYYQEKNIELEHYKYLHIEDYLINRSIELENYRKEYKEKNIDVYILNADASAYHIPEDLYYKNYDMFNIGNLGKDGEDGIIETIENDNNSIYLVLNEKLNPNWQTPRKVIKYIRENLKYKEDISIYQAYYKE